MRTFEDARKMNRMNVEIKSAVEVGGINLARILVLTVTCYTEIGDVIVLVAQRSDDDLAFYCKDKAGFGHKENSSHN